GIMMPLMMTILMLIFPYERRGFAMGMSGLVISFAPAIGPSLAGYIVEFLPWRSVFLVVIPIAIIDLILAYFFVRNLIERTFPKVDYPSIALSVFGFGGLLFGFSHVGNVGWVHWSVVTSIAIGAIALTLFIMRQLKLEQPVLEFRVFKNRVFTFTTIIGLVAFTLLIGAETILPIYMQVMAVYTAFDDGSMILPGAILMGIMSPIVGRFFDAIGARVLLITGLTIVVITTIPYTR